MGGYMNHKTTTAVLEGRKYFRVTRKWENPV